MRYLILDKANQIVAEGSNSNIAMLEAVETIDPKFGIKGYEMNLDEFNKLLKSYFNEYAFAYCWHMETVIEDYFI